MGLRNVKEELLRHIKEGRIVKCARITRGDDWGYEDVINFNLPIGFDQDYWNRFLSELDFTYDAGYGGQELFGYVWFQDGSWLERGEYDGSEWWAYKKTPVIPEELK